LKRKLQSRCVFGDDYPLSSLKLFPLQIALYNVGCFYESQDQLLAESVLLESLSKFYDMHTATTTKTLKILHRMFMSRRLIDQAKHVMKLAEVNNIQITRSAVKAMKRVAFVVDYSGSMLGTKIRTATDNINSIVADHINELDSVMVVHFNANIHVDIPLCQKQDQEEQLRTVISGMCTVFL
jgi:hypothetical protein